MPAHDHAVVLERSDADRGRLAALLVDRLGFAAVSRVETPQAAIDRLRAGDAGWVFSAWRLGHATAQPLFRFLSQHAAARPLPSILIADDPASASTMASRLGASDYVTRPLDVRAIVHATRRVDALLAPAGSAAAANLDCRLDLGFDPFNVYRAEIDHLDVHGCRLRTSPLKNGVGEIGDIGTLGIACTDHPPLKLHGRVLGSAPDTDRAGTHLVFEFDRLSAGEVRCLERLAARLAREPER